MPQHGSLLTMICCQLADFHSEISVGAHDFSGMLSRIIAMFVDHDQFTGNSPRLQRELPVRHTLRHATPRWRLNPTAVVHRAARDCR